MIVSVWPKESNSKNSNSINRLVYFKRGWINQFLPIWLIFFILLSKPVVGNPTNFIAPVPDFDLFTILAVLESLFFEVLVVLLCISHTCFNARRFISIWFSINFVSFILFTVFVATMGIFLGHDWGFLAILIGEILVIKFEAKVLQIFSMRYAQRIFYSAIDNSLAIRCSAVGNFASILVYAVCYKYLRHFVF